MSAGALGASDVKVLIPSSYTVSSAADTVSSAADTAAYLKELKNKLREILSDKLPLGNLEVFLLNKYDNLWIQAFTHPSFSLINNRPLAYLGDSFMKYCSEKYLKTHIDDASIAKQNKFASYIDSNYREQTCIDAKLGPYVRAAISDERIKVKGLFQALLGVSHQIADETNQCNSLSYPYMMYLSLLRYNEPNIDQATEGDARTWLTQLGPRLGYNTFVQENVQKAILKGDQLTILDEKSAEQTKNYLNLVTINLTQEGKKFLSLFNINIGDNDTRAYGPLDSARASAYDKLRKDFYAVGITEEFVLSNIEQNKYSANIGKLFRVALIKAQKLGYQRIQITKDKYGKYFVVRLIGIEENNTQNILIQETIPINIQRSIEMIILEKYLEMS